MAITGLVQFLKRQYDDFIPFWHWKRSPEPMKKKRTRRSYSELLEFCRQTQYVLAGFAILMALSFEHSRNLFLTAAVRDGLLLLLVELASYLFVGYFMGLKRFPANYISFVIIKSFVVLERTYRPDVAQFELKVLGKSRYHGQWSVLEYNPNPNIAVTPVETNMKNLSMMILSIAATWILTVYTKIDFSHSEKPVLLTTTAATSSAAMLLLTTFAFKQYPEIKPYHKRCCELWTIFAVTTFVFVLIFLFQRCRLMILGKLKVAQNLRMQWECILFMLGMYVLIRYIPVIHKGFSTREVLYHKTGHLLQLLVPEFIQDTVDLLITYVKEIAIKTAEIKTTHVL